MDNKEFKLCAQSLTDEEISEFVKTTGKPLPVEFTDHYKKYNGGFPPANQSVGEELDCPIRHFFSIKYGEDTIEKRMKELRFDNMIPFAMNKIMDFYCLAINEEDYGKIFYCDSYGPKRDTPEFELHAKDFSTFMNGLYANKLYGKVMKPGQGWVEDFDAYAKNW